MRIPHMLKVDLIQNRTDEFLQLASLKLAQTTAFDQTIRNSPSQSYGGRGQYFFSCEVESKVLSVEPEGQLAHPRQAFTASRFSIVPPSGGRNQPQPGDLPVGGKTRRPPETDIPLG